MSLSNMVSEKQRWRKYKTRIRKLPANYRATVEALERYLMTFGPGDGANTASMLEDIADLFEQSAADGTPIRVVVGEDPIEFVEAFLRSYPDSKWRTREQQRLIDAVDRVAGDKL